MIKPADLWKLPPLEFNKWRRENDLKHLFDCFQKTLPHFDEWLHLYEFSIDFILNTNKPGSFFYWNKETILFKTNEYGSDDYFFVPIEDKSHDKRLKKTYEGEKEKTVQYRFKPYFFWAKEKLKTDKIVKTNFNGEFDTFRYIAFNTPDAPEICSATISPGITVLKLGGTKINGWDDILFRNLDFTDLDFLEIEGKDSLSRETNIFYSSCRHLKFNNCIVNFSKFYACHFEELKSLNSRFYWTEFYDCDLFAAEFENSSLINFIVKDCSASRFSFNRVEVDNLIYTPPKKEWHTGVVRTYGMTAENYKRFRVLFQNNGHRKEAGEAYYKERYYELKYNFAQLEFKRAVELIWKNHFDNGLVMLKHNFSKLGSTISDFLSYLLWGFGERPFRTFLCSMFIVFAYTGLYFISNIEDIRGNLTNSFYLSSIMFTTLGFGDYKPFHVGEYKLLLASEALLGAFTFGLFIAGYANKSKY
ncbi:ion channel [Pedobacter sp. ASV28]|uniref:ion channel n=1 Tax=Pedobacter sp. ASV28 TaxID=2795123 RepID=UPI0018ED5AD4|nr:ion channel [Pedobacter sp. ASV28]